MAVHGRLDVIEEVIIRGTWEDMQLQGHLPGWWLDRARASLALENWRHPGQSWSLATVLIISLLYLGCQADQPPTDPAAPVALLIPRDLCIMTRQGGGNSVTVFCYTATVCNLGSINLCGEKKKN